MNETSLFTETDHADSAIECQLKELVVQQQDQAQPPATAALAAQAPAPASDGEREELAQWLEKQADDYDDLYPPAENLKLYRAAELLRAPAPAAVPVTVADRPWERPGWCDAEGRCWWFNRAGIPFQSQPPRMVCLHCGAREVLPLPLPVPEAERRGQDWIRRHRRCPRPGREQKP